MNKPKVEFYNLNSSLLPWPTDLKVNCSNLLVDVYVSITFERHSMKNNREFCKTQFCSILSPCALDRWPTHLKMYTANKQVTIYIPAKFERDSAKNDREIGWRRWWERRKIKSKKEKTLQQQEGLPTMSVDLNNVKKKTKKEHDKREI